MADTVTLPTPPPAVAGPAQEKNPPGESCASCAFSLDTGNVSALHGAQLGPGAVRLLKCRRFPPAAFPLAIQGAPGKVATPGNPSGAQMGSIAVWPDVAPGQWCGEWGSYEAEPAGKGSDKLG